jgi:hypothetical protein
LFSASVHGARAIDCATRLWKPRDSEAAHQVAVVDLADYLTAQHPASHWTAEHEVQATLAGVGRARARLPGDDRHPPDGILIAGGRRIGIELEHTQKAQDRYVRINRWFARELRLDEVRWYVDKPRLIDRLRELHRRYGYDRDIPARFEPLPPGVVVPRRLPRYKSRHPRTTAACGGES